MPGLILTSRLDPNDPDAVADFIEQCFHPSEIDVNDRQMRK
jgi:hypothetical protein